MEKHVKLLWYLLYAHVVIMLYAHVVSSYYGTLGLYACASVNSINSRDRPRRSPCARLHHILATRMTAVHGSFAPFDSAAEDWTEYIERLQFYFDANGI